MGSHGFWCFIDSYFQFYNNKEKNGLKMQDFCIIVHSFSKMKLIDCQNFKILVSQKLFRIVMDEKIGIKHINFLDFSQILSTTNFLGLKYCENDDFWQTLIQCLILKFEQESKINPATLVAIIHNLSQIGISRVINPSIWEHLDSSFEENFSLIEKDQKSFFICLRVFN